MNQGEFFKHLAWVHIVSCIIAFLEKRGVAPLSHAERFFLYRKVENYLNGQEEVCKDPAFGSYEIDNKTISFRMNPLNAVDGEKRIIMVCEMDTNPGTVEINRNLQMTQEINRMIFS